MLSASGLGALGWTGAFCERMKIAEAVIVAGLDLVLGSIRRQSLVFYGRMPILNGFNFGLGFLKCLIFEQHLSCFTFRATMAPKLNSFGLMY